MILDRRAGFPVLEKRLLTRDTRAKTYYPENIALQRNCVLSGRVNPMTQRPMWLESNLINDQNNPDMTTWSSNRTGPAPCGYHELRSMPSFSLDPWTRGYWYTSGGGDGQYLAFWNRGNARRATRYSITVENGYTPRSWRFEGSNDGIVWTTLHSYTQLETWPAGITKFWWNVPVENQDYYEMYRLVIDACDATDIRIRNFVVADNDATTDHMVYIKASETEPLVLSFADGEATHIVTLTEDRLVDVRGVFAEVMPCACVNGVFITAEYEPVSGILSFRTTEEDVIPPGGGDFTVYKSHYSKYGSGETYLPNHDIFTVDDQLFGAKSTSGRNAYARFSLLGANPSVPIYFNKLHYKTYASTSSLTYHKMTLIEDLPYIVGEDMNNNNWLPDTFTWHNPYGSQLGILWAKHIIAARKLQWGAATTDKDRWCAIKHFKPLMELATTLQMKADGKMYVTERDGSETTRKWVVVGFSKVGNVFRDVDYATNAEFFAGKVVPCAGTFHFADQMLVDKILHKHD